MSDTQAGALRIYTEKMMKIYRISFKSQGELYMYLKGEPEVNRDVFPKQSSISTDVSFAGLAYEWAVEYLLGGYNGEYDIVLGMQRDLERYVPVRSNEYTTERSFAGSHPDVPAYIAGSPRSMYRRKRTAEKKFCRVWLNLACPVKTTRGAILNRGALTLSLVKLLESQGISVDLRVFMSVYEYDEVFLFEISLKSPQEQLNSKKCFYPLCSREFVRRLIIRVMESMPFGEKSWFPNYGMSLSSLQFREIFSIPQTDLVISTPDEMGIYGYNIYYDGASMFSAMGIDKSIVIKLREAGVTA